MPSEVITIGSNFAATLGIAAFVGIPGRGDPHSHWTHQIAIDLEGGQIECFCDGQWLKGTGVFVPVGHTHSVQQGKQINMFFDPCVNWIDEIFGGNLDTSCARVLDRDTLQGIQSCFYEGADLVAGMSVFANAFELRTHTRMDPLAYQDWITVLAKVREIKQNSVSTQTEIYQQLGGLFAS